MSSIHEKTYLRASSYLKQAEDLHRRFPLCDGHNDLPYALRQISPSGANNVNSTDLTKDWAGERIDGPLHGCLHTDLVRLRKGGVGWQFFSVYTPTSEPQHAVQWTLEQIDVVHRLVDKYDTDLQMASGVEDVKNIWNDGKIACMCGIEGGHQIQNSLGALRMFYKLGCRYMTLTHNGGPDWADPALHIDGSPCLEASLGGLTPYGENVVLEMNRLGMLVDLSHVHHVTMERALTVTKAPVIFSHSSSRAICDHPRDVPDNILRMLPSNGGIIMVTFVSSFVAGKFWVKGNEVGATVLEVADHIDHIKEVAGIDHIGIGGDYDGCTDLAKGLEDTSCYTNLTAELLFRGYSENDLAKILSGNILRVLSEAERVRDEMCAKGCLPLE